MFCFQISAYEKAKSKELQETVHSSDAASKEKGISISCASQVVLAVKNLLKSKSAMRCKRHEFDSCG